MTLTWRNAFIFHIEPAPSVTKISVHSGRRRRRRSSTALVLSAAALATAGPAAAWNAIGHMTTGATAYDVLQRDDPAAVRAVLALVSALPQQARMDTALQGLSGAMRDRMTFEYLARWPDDIRGGPLDHPDWHYAVHIVSPGWTLIPYTAGHARQAYDQAMATLEDPHASRLNKAIAVAWVMHLAGDIQQPLHAGNRLTLPDFPKSDRAGTIGWVRTAPDAPPRSLHDSWDSAADPPGSEAPAAAALTAKLEGRGVQLPAYTDLRHRYDAAFQTWWRESYHLAKTVAYTGDGLREAPKPAAAPVLSPAYRAEARQIAEMRIRLGGIRIATSLAAAISSKPG